MSRPEPRWIQQLSTFAGVPRLRLFCFPYAGGTAAAYADWAADLPPGVALYAIHLPGRGPRLLEPAIGDVAVLVEQLRPAILPYLSLPFAFFGHSMGAMISWELARSLPVGPAHLFVSGARALPFPQTWLGSVDALSDAELTEVMRTLNGTPAEIFEDPDLLELVVPSFRADLGLLARYRYQPGPPLDCPVTVLGGDRDPVVPPGDLGGWEQLTTGDTAVRVLSGDHFFLHAARKDLLAVMAERLGIT